MNRKVAKDPGSTSGPTWQFRQTSKEKLQNRKFRMVGRCNFYFFFYLLMAGLVETQIFFLCLTPLCTCIPNPVWCPPWRLTYRKKERKVPRMVLLSSLLWWELGTGLPVMVLVTDCRSDVSPVNNTDSDSLIHLPILDELKIKSKWLARTNPGPKRLGRRCQSWSCT